MKLIYFLFALLSLSCGIPKINRINRVIESKTVNVQSLIGWVVIEQLSSDRYVIRNKNLIQEVKMPDWFGRVYAKGDTIK